MSEPLTTEQYIREVELALSYAREFYCSPDIEERRERFLMLARDIGYGLAVFSDEEIKKVITSTYGRLVVRNTMDRIGVPFNNVEWLREIERGIERGRGR